MPKRFKRKILALLLGNSQGSTLAQSLFDSAPFTAQLIKSLVLNRGVGSPTFTRATVATTENNDGYLVQAISGEARFEGARRIRNHAVNTENITAAGGWTLTNCTSVIGATDPDGGTTAFTVTATGANATIKRFTGHAPAANIASWYLRRVSGTGTIQIFAANNTPQTVTVTSSWNRLSSTVVSSPSNYIGVGIVTSGDVIEVWHPQSEDVTAQTTQTAGEYVSVGVLSTPWHGAGVDGVKYFDTDISGTAIPAATLKGYLAEGSRQNRCLHSQDFSNAAWVSGGGGIAVATNSTTAPNGTTTADTLTASGANGTLIQDLGVVASAAKAGGLWLKRKTGTGNVDLTLNGGTDWTTQTINSSTWTRCELTATLADEDFGIRLVTSGDEVYAWQSQVETAAFLSSAIPTTTAAVTRAASVDSIPTSGNITAAAGTIALTFTPSHDPYGTIALWGTYINASNYTTILHDATNLIFRKRIAGSNYDATIANAFVSGTSYKVAASWGTAGTTIVLDGVVGTPHANTTAAQIAATMQIGADGNSLQQPFAGIKNVRIWQTALSDSQLQAITK